MDSSTNLLLGVVFVVISAVQTFLMYYCWGFAFDKERLRSQAPLSLTRLHRVLGFVYIAIYLYLMWFMVPRMWTYQIELPARTVAHLLLGMSIGAILIVKLTIVRFFKHMESKLVPFLGTLLFICTLLLMGLAVPSAIREAQLRRAVLSGEVFSAERLARVRQFLPIAGLADANQVAFLATPAGLLQGQAVLRSKCVQCHDLRTVLARPRTPDAWRQTVRRMAERSTVLNPITEDDQWAVTAYLIAVSPTLQQTVELLREQERLASESARAVEAAIEDAPQIAYDAEAARALWELRCSQCHSPLRVAESPPQSVAEADQLVRRMVSNGLRASEEELAQIIRYIIETYVPDNAAGQPTAAPPTTATATAPTPTPVAYTPTPAADTPTPATEATPTLTPPDVAAVTALVGRGGCADCHTIPGITGATGRVGPNWCVPAGKFQSGAVGLDYLYQAITEPNATVAEGFAASIMPQNFGDVFAPTELDTLVAYIATLVCEEG